MTEKEIGMEKFVELLREYNMSNKSPYILGDADYYVDGGLYAPQIISKNFGFIQWLVENNKIDFDGIQNVFYRNKRYKEYRDYSDYESLLMLLAIQDEPINFLLDILK